VTNWGIYRWLFDDRPMHAMVANRILLGFVLLANYVDRGLSYQLFYGADAMAWTPMYRNFVQAKWNPAFDPFVRWIANHDLQGSVWILFVVMLLAAFSFMVGFRTRTSGWLLIVLHGLFVAIHPDVNWGWAKVALSFLLFTVLARPGDYFSVDAWLKKRAGAVTRPVAEWLGPAWPMRLVQINLCTMYAVAGLARLDHAGWLEGRMLMVALLNLTYARFNIDWLSLTWLAKLLSYAVFLLEPVAPITFWIRKLSVPTALSLIAMHAGLELLTNVGWWSYLMLTGLLCFLPPAWLRGLFSRLSRESLRRS